jgi:hypothetical protein
MKPPGDETADGRADAGSIMGDPRFAAEIALAEYKALRDEILKKMDHRTSLMVCSVTVSSAVLGFGIERQNGPLLLVSPLISVLLGIVIVFQGAQIGQASEYLRRTFDVPLSEGARGVQGWHNSTADPENRLRQRMLPYHFPLVLIVIAPAAVAVPLALADPDWVVWVILGVDGGLLAIYLTLLVRFQRGKQPPGPHRLAGRPEGILRTGRNGSPAL